MLPERHAPFAAVPFSNTLYGSIGFRRRSRRSVLALAAFTKVTASVDRRKRPTEQDAEDGSGREVAL